MPAPSTNLLTESIQHFKDQAEAMLSNPSAADFESLEKQLNELDAAAREVQQAMWSGEAQQTLRRLERGEPLTPADQDVIKAFLISDAEHYLAQENNFQDWTAELQRIAGELARRASMLNRESIGSLRGLLKDAVRLVPDIRNYFDERTRVSKFKSAMGSLDKASCQMLAKLLREQLSSAAR